MKSILALLLTVILIHRGVALQVTPGSTCAVLCLDDPETDPLDPDSSNTRPNDIVCSDEEYETLSTGIKYKNCIECLQKSNATSGNESDATWFLYNIRYTVDVCVYRFPNVSTKEISSPCNIDYGCAPLKKALETGIINSTSDQYGYCTAEGGKFTASQLDACVQCFASSSNQEYMANFITALEAGCQQKPEPGTLLGLSGSLFASTRVNITDSPVQATPEDKLDGSTAMTTGAIAGIAIGAGLLFVGGTALFWVYHRKQKRLYGAPIGSDYDPRNGCQSISPPLNSGASYENKGQPSMSDYELRAQRAYTDNVHYYDALEKEIQIRRPNYAFDPNNLASGRQGALPTHFAYDPRAHSRQTSRDSILQGSKPVKSNKPDAYAMEVYLNSVEDANLGIPRTPPVAVARGPSPRHNPSPPQSSQVPAAHLSSYNPNVQHRPMNLQSQAPRVSSPLPATLPPPPPPQSKVPSLNLPSVPRIRVPKKYAPPNIVVDGALPAESFPAPNQQTQGDLAVGLDISNPIVSHEPRLEEGPPERRKKEPPPPLVLPQLALDHRPPRWVVQDAEVKTGSSEMYG